MFTVLQGTLFKQRFPRYNFFQHIVEIIGFMSSKPKWLFLDVRQFLARCPDMQPTNSEILKNSLRVREKLWAKGVQKLPRLGAGIAVAAGGDWCHLEKLRGWRPQHRSCRIKAVPSGQDQWTHFMDDLNRALMQKWIISSVSLWHQDLSATSDRPQDHSGWDFERI